MDSRVVTAVLVLLAGALAAGATLGLRYAALGLAVAVMAFLFAILGRERTAVLVLGGAFATAPMYRGIIDTQGANPTDLLVLLGVLLLLPSVLTHELRVPMLYLVGLGALAVFGLRSAVVNVEPIGALLFMAVLIFYLGFFPIFIAWWQPARATIDFLLWCYLAGQTASLLKALAEGPLVNDRYDGLAHHANAFGMGGVVAVAIILYLLPHYRDWRVRAVLVVIALGGIAAVIMSGSRAATVVVAAIILLVPVVERSALAAVGLAVAACVSVAFLPYAVSATGEGSSLTRLVGDATARSADSERSEGLDYGLERFAQNPLFGTGFDANVGLVHNLFLEVAVGVGVFGLVAYLAVLFVFARPVLGTHPLRRLSYIAWVLIVIGPAVPGLTDRTIVVPMALAILPAVTVARQRRASPTTGGDPVATRKEVPGAELDAR
ncbi:O-antigen ligase family protein [Nocardioides bizhenqiangii]|uniref:O-antigen ligase family protein n=1 Tax=Nocardioides bizhenqiangii TaxID=3095076 RepID=A0ABZ0ZP58_9ACTN|nr:MULTISPECIES: O-antigen ligase family protein [unclassified Nocardioides]MDZ5620000.1 O-antigen ligase family protein [Nocardioides sp. HM23]WQQ25998.1 O-antigen ligase family protein [Nocardioides sp. HM61]